MASKTLTVFVDPENPDSIAVERPFCDHKGMLTRYFNPLGEPNHQLLHDVSGMEKFEVEIPVPEKKFKEGDLIKAPFTTWIRQDTDLWKATSDRWITLTDAEVRENLSRSSVTYKLAGNVRDL